MSLKLLSAWVFAGLNTISGLILLPLLLTKFSVTEMNVWLLFFSVIGISEMIVMGFNVTFVRFVSYTYAGVDSRDFRTIRESSSSFKLESRGKQLSDIFSINMLVFLVISAAFFLLLQTVGYLALQKPISYMDQPDLGWRAWQILVYANTFRVLGYTFPVFLQGMDRMGLYYNILSFEKLFYVVGGVLVLTLKPSIIGISIVSALSISLTVIIQWISFKIFSNREIKFSRFRKDLFLIIWESAWKSGVTKLIAPIIQRISGIIFAQIATPGLSGSYLLTERVFNILQNFSLATVNTYIPQISRMRGKNKFPELTRYIYKIGTLSYSVFLLGYLVVALFGTNMLKMINSGTTLADPLILILFSYAYLLQRIGGFQANLANQANNVIEHKAILVYAAVFFGFLLVMSSSLEMWIFPAAIIMAQIVTNIYIFKYSYPMYKTTFWETEKYGFIPILILLSLINFIL